MRNPEEFVGIYSEFQWLIKMHVVDISRSLMYKNSASAVTHNF